MADTNDKLTLYKEADRPKGIRYEDCIVFVNGMLATLKESDPNAEDQEPITTAEIDDYLNLGLMPLSKQPPGPETDVHNDPWVVMYRGTNDFIRPRFGLSGSPLFFRHVALFDGYAPNPDGEQGTVPMVLAKDNLEGDVERHPADQSDYGNDLYYVSVHEAQILREHIKRHGYKSSKELWSRQLELRNNLNPTDDEMIEADTKAKHMLLKELGLDTEPPKFKF